jgi:hypothetical protein
MASDRLIEALAELAASNRDLAEALRDNAEATREATAAEFGEAGTAVMED